MKKKEFSFSTTSFTLFLSVCALIGVLLFILGYQVGRVQGMKYGGRSSQDQESSPREDVARVTSTPATSFTSDKYSFYESVHRATPIIAVDKKQKPKPTKTAALKHPTALPTPKSSSSAGTAQFTIQVASFQDLTKARALEQKLKQANFPAYLSAFELPSHEKRYRVRVGQYADKTSAERTAAQIKARENLETWVTPLH